MAAGADGMGDAEETTRETVEDVFTVLAAVFCVLGVLPLIVLTQVGIIVGLGILFVRRSPFRGVPVLQRVNQCHAATVAR